MLSVLITAGLCIASQVYGMRFAVSGDESIDPVPQTASVAVEEVASSKLVQVIVAPTATISASPLTLEERVKKLEARVSELEAKK